MADGPGPGRAPARGKAREGHWRERLAGSSILKRTPAEGTGRGYSGYKRRLTQGLLGIKH